MKELSINIEIGKCEDMVALIDQKIMDHLEAAYKLQDARDYWADRLTKVEAARDANELSEGQAGGVQGNDAVEEVRLPDSADSGQSRTNGYYSLELC